MEVKEIWTEEDFDIMGWHDCYIYSMTFPGEDFEIIFDIDYLFKWHQHEAPNRFSFWVSPCSLTFLNVSNLKLDINFENSIGIYISDIFKKNPRPSLNGKYTVYDFIIETDKGIITFDATGYIQRVREQPIASFSQILTRRKVN